jgi:hypothetical protein
MSDSPIPSTPPPRVHANANPGTPKASPDPLKSKASADDELGMDREILTYDDPSLHFGYRNYYRAAPGALKDEKDEKDEKKGDIVAHGVKRKREDGAVPATPPPSPASKSGKGKANSKDSPIIISSDDDSDGERDDVKLFTTLPFQCRRSDKSDIESTSEELFDHVIAKLRDAHRLYEGKGAIKVTFVDSVVDDNLLLDVYDPAEHKDPSPEEKRYTRNACFADFISMAFEEFEGEITPIAREAVTAIAEKIEELLVERKLDNPPTAEKLLEICQDTLLMELSAEILSENESKQSGPAASPVAPPPIPAPALPSRAKQPPKKIRKIEKPDDEEEEEEVGEMSDDL